MPMRVLQYYAFVEEKQKVHCLNTLFSKVRPVLLIHREPPNNVSCHPDSCARD